MARRFRPTAGTPHGGSLRHESRPGKCPEVAALLEVSARHVREVFRGHVAVLLPDAGGGLRSEAVGGSVFVPGPRSWT